MIICEHNQCTGCGACLNICGKHAIIMREEENGHPYPVINDDLCVKCGSCKIICPNNKPSTPCPPITSFVATARKVEEAKESASAGAASALSRKMIRDGGVVYGCSGSRIDYVCHIRITKDSEVGTLKGSKYVQSSLIDIYPQIKEDIARGIVVLFIGTPCQVAGIKNYLHNPDNLVTVDLICHGVPSQRILSDAIHSYLPHEDISQLRVSFRKKERGRILYGLFVENNQGKCIYRSTYPSNEYVTGFLTGLFYRESCYQCRYSRPERVSDITLGDYWDHENKINIDNKYGGLSMVIVNTEKGHVFLKDNIGSLNLIEADYNGFVKRNGQLHHPVKKHDKYDEFIAGHKKSGFLKASRKCLRKTKRQIKWNLCLNGIARFLKSISL